MDWRVKGKSIEHEGLTVLEMGAEYRFFYVVSDDASLEGWYFHSREGAIGPYRLLSQAETMAKAYAMLCKRLASLDDVEH